MIKKLAILSFIMAIPFWAMADVSNSTKWQISNTATAGNLNGGGFVTGASGTDYSNQDTAQFVLTTATATGAGNIFISTSASSTMVGNIAHVIAGLNFRPGWYEIVSVSGSSITVSTKSSGQSIVTGVASTGTIYIGGRLSLGSTLDNEFFNAVSSGNVIYIQNGNYTLGETVNVTISSANIQYPIRLEGYNSVIGDRPSILSGNQPVIACGANSITFPVAWSTYYVSFTGTATGVLTFLSFGDLFQSKVTNTSTIADRAALIAGSASRIISGEFVSQNGDAIRPSSTLVRLVGNYIHDSKTGVATQSNTCTYFNNLVVKCSATGISLGGSSNGNNTIFSNTIVGYSTVKGGNGVTIPVGNGPYHLLMNNIISQWTTAVNKTTTPNYPSNQSLSNNYFDNTANTSLYFSTGTTDLFLDPQFVDDSELSGSTATTSGSVLTGGTSTPFTNVVDNVDYVRIFSGTGVTVATYLITSHTADTLTVNNSLGTSSAGDVVFAITTGKNYNVGANLAGQSVPGYYGPGTYSNAEIGAIQRKNQNTSVFIQ